MEEEGVVEEFGGAGRITGRETREEALDDGGVGQLVIRDPAFKGKSSFSDFLASDEGIARNVLADRLARLETAGFIEKQPHPDDLRRSIYRLTDRWLGLIPVPVEMILWSAREDPDTGAEADFAREATEDREGLIRRLQQRP